MRKRELAQAVAAHTEVDPKVAARVIDGTLEVILATVAKGEDVALTGFAKRHERVPMVGRTHLQPAMPSSVGLWASAGVAAAFATHGLISLVQRAKTGRVKEGHIPPPPPEDEIEKPASPGKGASS